MRIIIKDLSFSYNPKAKPVVNALDNLSLTIEEGEFFGIIGQTGSGKSTLIQHLNALIPLQSGNVFVGDFDLSLTDKKSRARLKELRSKVGMVFQYPEYQLFAESVYEEVAFAIKNFFPEVTGEQLTQRVGDALTAVGLDYNAVKDKSPFDLSGGQKRRVAIAGVLVANPEILVLDEPVAGLDPVGKRELMDLLHRLNTNNRTIIIVSHDMDEVAENCTRVAVMKNGKIVGVGTPAEVFEKTEDRLALPVTAKIKNTLNNMGVSFNSPLKIDEFIDELEKVIKQNKN